MRLWQLAFGLVVTALMAWTVTGRATPADFRAGTEKVIDGYVLPQFGRLREATKTLADDFDAACGGDKARFVAVRADYERTVLAWAAVDFLRFGPLTVTGRPERFAFWPDPRGVTARQLRAFIAAKDASVLDPKVLGEKSAAIQGLTALEFLLTTPEQPLDGASEEGRYRCRLAASIAHNLDTIARDILAEWNGPEGWRVRMLSAGSDNLNYRAANEPPGEFARALITGLQLIQDRQVTPLVTENATGKKARLPFERSGLNARYVVAAVASLKQLYEATGLGVNVPDAKSWMTEWIGSAWGRLAADAPVALEEKTAAKDPEERKRQLRMLRFHVEGIRKLVGRELAPLAGLTIGFNELDGD